VCVCEIVDIMTGDKSTHSALSNWFLESSASSIQQNVPIRKIIQSAWAEYYEALLIAIDEAACRVSQSRISWPDRVPIVLDMERTTSVGISFADCQYKRVSMDYINSNDQYVRARYDCMDHPFSEAQRVVEKKYGIKLVDESPKGCPDDGFARFFLHKRELLASSCEGYEC
jgi:hypothetical protein